MLRKCCEKCYDIYQKLKIFRHLPLFQQIKEKIIWFSLLKNNSRTYLHTARVRICNTPQLQTPPSASGTQNRWLFDIFIYLSCLSTDLLFLYLLLLLLFFFFEKIICLVFSCFFYTSYLRSKWCVTLPTYNDTNNKRNQQTTQDPSTPFKPKFTEFKPRDNDNPSQRRQKNPFSTSKHHTKFQPVEIECTCLNLLTINSRRSI